MSAHPRKLVKLYSQMHLVGAFHPLPQLLMEGCCRCDSVVHAETVGLKVLKKAEVDSLKPVVGLQVLRYQVCVPVWVLRVACRVHWVSGHGGAAQDAWRVEAQAENSKNRTRVTSSPQEN